MIMNKRAFAYARKSKEDKDDPKWSIPTQIERIRESAERRGETFAGAFEDRDVSGARPFAERPGWTALEAQLQSGDVVIVNDLSRFSRDTDTAKHKLSDLADRGVEVVALGIEGIDRKSADGRMLLGIFLEFTEWQRQKTIENLLQVHKRIHDEGKALGCRPAYGWDYDIEAKVWSVNLAEAEIVERIFALKIAGFGYQTIAKKLNDEGIPTKRVGQTMTPRDGDSFSCSGKWRTNTIKRIIENRRYIGEREYLGVIRPLDIPAIIDRETWEMAQASVRHQVHAPRTTHVLSGLLSCDLCGHTLHRVRRWKDGEALDDADWRCPECGKLAIRETIVLPAVLEQFFDHLDPERYKESLKKAEKAGVKREGRREVLLKRLGVLERKQARLLDELGRDDTTLTRDAFNKKNGELQGEIDELSESLQELDDDALLSRRPDVLGNIREDWGGMDVLSQQTALRAFITRVTVVSSNGVQGSDRVVVTWR